MKQDTKSPDNFGARKSEIEVAGYYYGHEKSSEQFTGNLCGLLNTTI
ncbi:hypothetical protein PC116_g3055 [Phytophthora cactorum]|nr:hypothetical protein PC112_g19057 [Phytophthora cactorum]KAG2834755.1 hypothetical protein PC111_g5690 [Phytophthora cactorum]KAG2867675.1 hypothetical protein PC113_g1718 [Phytophthora cactorum]KAG2941814.1 hypothetical protein PC115_g1765 [Phytophthora cactorum]KAG2986153.1 hypothetical protein PC120_g23887 [Phytophthora cactorum]